MLGLIVPCWRRAGRGCLWPGHHLSVMLMERGLWSPFGGHSWLPWLPGLVSTETDRGNADSVVGLKNTDTLSFGGIKKRNLKKNKKKPQRLHPLCFWPVFPSPL